MNAAIDFDDYHRNIRIDGGNDGANADPECLDDAFGQLVRLSSKARRIPGGVTLAECVTAAAAYVATEWTLEILTETGIIDRAECIPEMAFTEYCAGFSAALGRRLHTALTTECPNCGGYAAGHTCCPEWEWFR